MNHRLVSRGLQLVNGCLDLLGCPLYELFGYGVSRYELEEHLGVSHQRSRAVAWRSAATCCKAFNQQRIVRRFGLESVLGLMEWQSFPEELMNCRREQQPILLVGWHCGPIYSVPAALWALGLETLCCVGPPPPFKVPEGLTYVPTVGAEVDRADALHQALKRLREGGCVYLVADHPTYSRTRASLCGRQVSFSPSISMLSRVSRARVVPVAARWAPDGRIVIEHGPSLEFTDSEQQLYDQLARWFEAFFRAHPHILEPKYLMKVMFSPPVEEMADSL